MDETTARRWSGELAELWGRERHQMVEFLLSLARFHERKGWVPLGYSSLFTYLHDELGMSKGAAYYRQCVAVLLVKVPEVTPPLRDGRLCLTAVVELSKVLTRENYAELLPRFFHRSKREAKELSAALRPREAPPERDAILEVQPVEPTASATLLIAPDRPAPTQPSAPPERPRDEAEPMTAALSRLHVTVSKAFLAQLEQAKVALSHKFPRGGLEEVLGEGLRLILREHARRKALTERPRPPSKGKSSSATISAAARRAVFLRDQGRCQWPLAAGGICASTHRIEIDHIHAKALGGASTPDNLRLLCRVHNDLAAQRTFGEAWMERYKTKSREATPPPPSRDARSP
jgi:5-methylcytosine-specific restriction endonuclease McrA